MNPRSELERYVDSSSEPYLRSVREFIARGWGMNVPYWEPFGSETVLLKIGRILDAYPLYSGGNVRN